ncbi:MAG: thiamine pyrophosphate-dependent enzyme, partial [Clostridium sp.]
KNNKEWTSKINDIKASIKVETSEEGPLTPQFLFKKLGELDKGDFILTTEVGQHQMWASQYFNYKTPRTFISSGGLGTMGFGMGAAIGAQMGMKNKRVFNIAGDGSFGMNCNEIATAVTNNLPIIIVIMNNNSLGMVRQWQNFFYEERYSATTLNRATDFVKLAEAFGAKGLRVHEKQNLEDVLKEALNTKGPVVIDYIIHKDKKVFPMVVSGAPINQMITEED